jgi:hypothetical protein
MKRKHLIILMTAVCFNWYFHKKGDLGLYGDDYDSSSEELTFILGV